jgi:hypothetical protein
VYTDRIEQYVPSGRVFGLDPFPYPATGVGETVDAAFLAVFRNEQVDEVAFPESLQCPRDV